MPAHIKKLLKELKQGLVRIYGEQLKAVYLYGSYARGDYVDGSDLDILVVLKDYEYYGTELDRTSKMVSDLSLEHEITVSPVFMKERDWLKGEKPLLRNLQAEGVAV